MTRLSFALARKLNISEDIIREAEEHAARAERSRAVREDLELAKAVEPPKPSQAQPTDGYRSKLERDFAGMLECAERGFAIHRWYHEPIKFRLAGRTWYQPDFLVEAGVGFTFVETKGFMRDDAAVKIKVAASMYPCFRWLLVRRDGRHNWDVREVNRNGIGREPITVPWIGG